MLMNVVGHKGTLSFIGISEVGQAVRIRKGSYKGNIGLIDRHKIKQVNIQIAVDKKNI